MTHRSSTVPVIAGTKLPQCGRTTTPSLLGAASRAHQASTVRPDDDTKPPRCDRIPAPSFHNAAIATPGLLGATGQPHQASLRCPLHAGCGPMLPHSGRCAPGVGVPLWFYEWRSRPKSARWPAGRSRKAKIAVLLELFDSVYGDRRIHAEMVRDGGPNCPEWSASGSKAE
jgi:hypothetical protein